MDPSKSAEASSEKSNMGHAAPPPYQDNLYQGYPQPGPGYPQPGPGYAQPGPGYPQPGQGYPPNQGYGGPQYPGGQPPYQGQPATVTVQPTVYVTRGPLEHPVNDYLCYSIFTMLCCCLPLGVGALIYSISTREANHAGDQMGAERSSRMARILNHVGLGIGVGSLVLVIVYVAVMSSVINNNN